MDETLSLLNLCLVWIWLAGVNALAHTFVLLYVSALVLLSHVNVILRALEFISSFRLIIPFQRLLILTWIMFGQLLHYNLIVRLLIFSLLLDLRSFLDYPNLLSRLQLGRFLLHLDWSLLLIQVFGYRTNDVFVVELLGSSHLLLQLFLDVSEGFFLLRRVSILYLYFDVRLTKAVHGQRCILGETTCYYGICNSKRLGH